MSGGREDLDAYVSATAAALGLPIAAESRSLVIDGVARLMAAAALVMAFPLPDAVEAAPVFQP
jgi:1-carboxybiuret hydrolase subunit AtzG-like protein